MGDLPVSIRQACAQDLDTIADVHARSRAAYHGGFVPEEELTDPARADHHRIAFGRYLASADHTVLCASHGDLLAGFAVIGPCIIPDPDAQITTELHSIYVDPSWFRERIGTKLHDACLQAWQGRQASAARLWVMDYNRRARAFYTSQGWEPDGHHHPDNSTLLGYRLAIPRARSVPEQPAGESQ
jgi:ribosomal protein S18 acetylase RimI-like enzyme